LLDNPGGAFLTGCRAYNVHASNPIEYYKLTELITKGELLHHAGEEKENDEFPPSPPPEAEETNSFAVSGM
jgi:hypothetical protein